MKLKYLTPYLLTPEAYARFGIEKAYAVYITNKDESEYEVTIYNKAHTDIIDTIAWLSEGDFEGPYSSERAKEIQKELNY